jgi:mRNA-degrading endonuclease toxin of MazEF toxin-antitoxin module
VKRGELWLAHVGRKTRPVLVLTRSEVLDVRALVTVAEVTSVIDIDLRGETAYHVGVGLERPSVVNCDGIHTVAQDSLTQRVGQAGEGVMRRVCSAISYALGC